MKQNQKLNVRIRINEQRMKEGKAQIFIRIFVDGLKTEIGTTHCVKTTHLGNILLYLV
jgi:hypothetical protein